MLARVYLASNKQAEALAKLETVLSKNPKDTAALMQVAMIQSQAKNYTAARDACEKLLAVNPQFGPALNNLAYLYAEQFNQLDKAFELARKGKDLAPQDPYTADTLGWIVYKRGDYPWALSLLHESATKMPSTAEVLYHLGMTHYMMGEEDPARTALQRAVQLSADFPGRDEAARCLNCWPATPMRPIPRRWKRPWRSIPKT